MCLVDGHKVPCEDAQGTVRQPTPAARIHRGDRRSAAPCRAVVDRGSIVDGGEGRWDLSRLLWMDLWVVRSQTCCFARGDRWSGHQTEAVTDLKLAPYLRRSVLDRVAEGSLDAECTLGMNPSALKTGECRTRTWESRRRTSLRSEGLVLGGTAQQMLDLQRRLQTEVR